MGSSGSSGRVRGGPRNMKSMRPPSAAIFFMTYFYRAGGGAMAPLAPPLDPLLMGTTKSLPPANEVWGKVIFLHLFVILFTGGVCMVAGGHVWLQGACVVAGGHAWLQGACMVVGGMHGCWGVMCGCRGACMVAGGRRVCMVARGVCVVVGEGACMVVGAMCRCRGACMVVGGGMHGCRGACMVAGGCMIAGGARLWGACVVTGGMHGC